MKNIQRLKEWKGGDVVNVCDFGGAVRELCKIICCFGLKDVALADSDGDEDDWESGWAERRFDLGRWRQMEVSMWSRMIVTSMMMIIVMIVVVVCLAMFQ